MSSSSSPQGLTPPSGTPLHARHREELGCDTSFQTTVTSYHVNTLNLRPPWLPRQEFRGGKPIRILHPVQEQALRGRRNNAIWAHPSAERSLERIRPQSPA